MDTLIIGHDEVRALMPMAECVDVMEDALRALARGDASLPLRTITPLRGGSGSLAVMPAAVGSPPAFGAKVISWFPSNHGTPLDAHQGAVLLFEHLHGRLLAVIDAGAVTAVRTAAVSGVATRALARHDASDLAILGSGIQASTHLDAMLAVRSIARVRVYSPNPSARHGFAERAAGRHRVRVEASDSARAAVEGADLVCTVTSATIPVVSRDWLASGVHLNAVGACTPQTRELDSATVADARFYVDRRESALHEAGDLLLPRAEGRVTDAHIAGELGEVLIGRVPGRRSPTEITVFESLGLAVEDVAAAQRIYENALARGMGSRVRLAGTRAAGV